MKEGAKVFLGVGGVGAAVLTIWLLTRAPFDVCQYDRAGDGHITIEDALDAEADYFDGLITLEQAERVIDCYFSGEHCSVC